MRDWTRFLRHQIKKISGFTRPHVIGFVADIIFSTLESVFIFLRIRYRIRRIRVDGSRIRNEKVADSKISGYVWTGPNTTRQITLHIICINVQDVFFEKNFREFGTLKAVCEEIIKLHIFSESRQEYF